MKALATLLCGLAAWAVPDDDPVEVLMRVQDRVMTHAQRIPNHTCTETITRDRYDYTAVPAPKSCDALLGRRTRPGVGTLIRLASTDRLRLEVALADSREIYSWPGAAQFDDREIDEFVPPPERSLPALLARLCWISSRSASPDLSLRAIRR
jgi:hypothetical protein